MKVMIYVKEDIALKINEHVPRPLLDPFGWNYDLDPYLTLGLNHNDATSGSNFWMPRGRSGHPGGNLDDHDYCHDHQDYDNDRN